LLRFATSQKYALWWKVKYTLTAKRGWFSHWLQIIIGR